MKNKLLALILALSMVFSILVLAPTTAVAAETDENVANEATTVLMALNILQGTADGSLQLSSNITRAEFASMLARTLRGTDELNSNAGAVMNTTPSETPENVSSVKSANTAAVSAPGKALANVGSTYSTSIDSTDYVDPSYSDVSALHWAYNDIEYLRGIGAISGYSDGTFKPDDNILYEDAVKFIVSALGYDFMAVTYGGYPNGYMRTANTLKILKNATGTTGLSATRQQVIVMLFNALTVDYLVLDKVSDGLNVYESGKNILKYIFDVEKIEGTVTANEDSGIYALSQASDEGKIEIGSDEFKCNVDQYKKYLGYPVTAYVKYDDDNATTGTLYAMFPESNIRTQKITSEDIISANITGNSNTVEAYINDKEETIKLADEPLIIYDGVAYGRNVSDATFNIEFGNVTFISTDGSRTYDLILIEDYLPMYVDKVNASSLKFSGTVYSEGQIINDYEVCLDEDENDITAYIFNADGTEAKFSDIKEDSVVYVKKWGTYIAVDLGGQVISGAVSGKSGEDVFVNDTKYDSISSNLLVGYNLNDKIVVGLSKENVIFYTDRQGGAYSGLSYGLIMDTNVGTEGGFNDETFEIKLMDSTGKIAYYKAADNMKFTDYLGNTYKFNNEGKTNSKTGAELQSLLIYTAKYASLQGMDSAAGGSIPSLKSAASSEKRKYEQVVKYTASNGEITEIVTAMPASSLPSRDKASNYFTCENTNVAGPDHHINKGKIFGTPYIISDAVTFHVSKSATPDDGDYKVGKMGTGPRDGNHGIVVFDAGEDGVVACEIVGNASSKSSTNAGYSVTNVVFRYKQEATIEDKGDRSDVYELGFIQGGANVTKYSKFPGSSTTDYFAGQDYKVGDIISPYTWASSGYWWKEYTYYYPISDLIGRIIVGKSNQYFHNTNGIESWGNYEYEDVFGAVTGAKNGNVIIAYGENLGQEVVGTVKGQKAVQYDCKTGYVKIVDATEVTTDDWAYMQLNNKDFKMMVIFTNIDSASLSNIKTYNDED